MLRECRSLVFRRCYLQPLVLTSISIRAYDGSSLRVGYVDDPRAAMWWFHGGVLMPVNNLVNTLYTMAVRHRDAALR